MNRVLYFQKSLEKFLYVNKRNLNCTRLLLSSGELGSGAGKGGGSGGSIRNAGGSFGKMEAVREEEYFRKLSQKQIHALKEHLEEEMEQHKLEIEKHEEGIKRHRRRVDEIANLIKEKSDTK